MNPNHGVVLSGANNIFQVAISDQTVLCRIKGKVLKSDQTEYNALAPGDRVEISDFAAAAGEPMILARLERKNQVSRWNRKRRALQTLAANLDCAAAVTSPQLPPFRPRFIDRVLAACELGGVDAAIIVNKIDQELRQSHIQRLAVYRDLGYRVFEVSALDRRGLDELSAWLRHKRVALVGQSGVGKSSLINALIPEAQQRTGEISVKYQRGRHVTTVGSTISTAEYVLIDTPGIREIDLYPHEVSDIGWAFREFRDVECAFSRCSHLHEPDCGVRRLLETGEIDTDRYTSYQNIVADRETSARAQGSA